MGLKRQYVKLSFLSVEDLTKVKREIHPAVRKNKERDKSQEAYMRYGTVLVLEFEVNIKMVLFGLLVLFTGNLFPF